MGGDAFHLTQDVVSPADGQDLCSSRTSFLGETAGVTSEGPAQTRRPRGGALYPRLSFAPHFPMCTREPGRALSKEEEAGTRLICLPGAGGAAGSRPSSSANTAHGHPGLRTAVHTQRPC